MVKTLELSLPETTAAHLEQVAERLNLSPQQLAVLILAEKFAQLESELDPKVREASDYVLKKNAGLYKRLA